MVRVKGKCLHKYQATPDNKKCEQIVLNTKEAVAEVERWREILSVNYANYRLERGLPV